MSGKSTTKKTASKEAPADFDKRMEALEEVVKKLETGDLPLEEAFELFQQGMALHAECSERLGKMEKKIETLIKSAQGEATKESVEDEAE